MEKVKEYNYLFHPIHTIMPYLDRKELKENTPIYIVPFRRGGLGNYLPKKNGLINT